MMRSRTLDMKFRLEIGLKLDKSSVGKLCFLRRGRTDADLNESGKMPSESARLIMLVMGSKRESRHDLIRKVGMISRAQEALEDSKNNSLAALDHTVYKTNYYDVTRKTLKNL